MSVIELHPEELLERADSDTLALADRARLEAHLRDCPACRLLQQARADFAAEREAPESAAWRAPRLAPAVLEALTQQADNDHAAEHATGRGATPGGWSRLPSGRAARVTLLAAAVALIGSAAAASGWIAGTWRLGWSDNRAIPVLGPAATAASAPDPIRAVPQPVAQPVAAEPPTKPEPPAAASGRVEAGPLPPAGMSGPAAKLFHGAAEARTAGDYDRALQLYRELQERFPSSDEARASRAIVGRLLLDTGQAEAAVADYDEYLADGGAPLTEEAMVGRAQAYRRLGRQAAEREAWAALLRRFPGSLHADQARARLQSLGAGPEE